MLSFAFKTVSKAPLYYKHIGYTFCKATCKADANRCIDRLKEEHVVIWNTLNALNGYRKVLDEKQSRNGEMVEDLKQFIEFFNEYAANMHYKQEEVILFPAIKDYGFDLIEGHRGIYLQDEHISSREYIESISNGIRGGKIDNIDELCAIINDFVPSLQSHAQKEDKILFNRIMQKVPQDVMEKISKNMDKSVKENKKKEKHLLNISDGLCKKYGKEAPEYKTQSTLPDFDDI
eukprot:137946_1